MNINDAIKQVFFEKRKVMKRGRKRVTSFNKMEDQLDGNVNGE